MDPDAGEDINEDGATGKLSNVPDSMDLVGSFTAEEGGDIKSMNCEKNPGHEGFIPVTKFKLDDIPDEYRIVEKLNSILLWAELTVKIKVKYVSLDRPETFQGTKAKFPNFKFRGSLRKVTYGSGYIFSITPGEDLEDLDKSEKAECLCLLCQQSDEPLSSQSWYFTVITSIHVIYDSSEAKRSIIECFYDSDETRSEKARYLYGVKMYPQVERDREKMAFVICVTHDRELAETLQALIKQRHDSVIWNDSSLKGPAVLISHPHGCSKTITMGQVLHLTVPTGDEYSINNPILFEDETECILPYRSLSEVPMMDFVQAHGQDLHDSEKSEQIIDDDSTGNLNPNNMAELSNQTNLLTLEECSTQTSGMNSLHTLQTSTASSVCSDPIPVTGNQSCSSVLANLPGDSTSICSNPDIHQKSKRDMSNSIPSLGDNETANLDDKQLIEARASNLERVDDSNLQDGADSFSVYYVDEPLDEETTLSVPDPDHLISLLLPPQMTFTLPDGAEFARRYNNMKALFHLPPGTKFHLSDGKEVYLPQEAQFYSNRASIQTGYMSYTVDSCPSSSGGCMLLDGGNTFAHTFPHAGSASEKVSLCGLRCYPILPSAI